MYPYTSKKKSHIADIAAFSAFHADVRLHCQYSRAESNRNRRNRNPKFYPLNYGSNDRRRENVNKGNPSCTVPPEGLQI